MRKHSLKNGWEDIERLLYYQNFLYILEIICINLINRYNNDSLAGYFDIKKT